MSYLVITVILFIVWAVILANTRTAQLKRMAHTLHLHYDKQVDTVLLPDSSAKAQFFKRGLHQFYHVLTFRDAAAFMRVCEDRIFSSPLDKKPVHIYTLVAVELTQGTFPPFILQPRMQEQTPGTNLPPELATRYTLNAPEGFALPSPVIGFLKAHPNCYVECTPTALLYCEFNTVPVAQIQPLRFRALQLLKEFVQKPQPAAQPATLATPQLTDAELQAQLLLKLQAAPRTASQPSRGNGRYVYAVILFALLGMMLLLAWYVAQHGIAH